METKNRTVMREFSLFENFNLIESKSTKNLNEYFQLSGRV